MSRIYCMECSHCIVTRKNNDILCTCMENYWSWPRRYKNVGYIWRKECVDYSGQNTEDTGDDLGDYLDDHPLRRGVDRSMEIRSANKE